MKKVGILTTMLLSSVIVTSEPTTTALAATDDSSGKTINGMPVQYEFDMSQWGSNTPESGNNVVVDYDGSSATAILPSQEEDSIYEDCDDGYYDDESYDNGYYYEEEFIKDDTEPPKISGVENSGAYNHNVTLKFSDNEEITEIDINGKEYESVNEMEFTKDGEYVIIVKDSSGNTSKITFTIDRKKPTFDAYFLDVVPDKYEDHSVKNGDLVRHYVDVCFEDSESSIVSAKVNGVETFKDDLISGYIACRENKKYDIEITDKAGNKNKLSFRIDYDGARIKIYNKGKLVKKNFEGSKIDYNGPHNDGTCGDSTYYTTKKVTIKYKENYKIKSAKILYGVSLNGKKIFLKNKSIPKSGYKIKKYGGYLVQVKDAAGNITTKLIIVAPRKGSIFEANGACDSSAILKILRKKVDELTYYNGLNYYVSNSSYDSLVEAKHSRGYYIGEEYKP